MKKQVELAELRALEADARRYRIIKAAVTDTTDFQVKSFGTTGTFNKSEDYGFEVGIYGYEAGRDRYANAPTFDAAIDALAEQEPE